MAKKEEEIEIKSLAIQESIEKKLNSILKDFKILKLNSDLSLSQMRNTENTYIVNSFTNLLKLELFNVITIVVAIGIVAYKVSNSFIAIIALLATVFIALIVLVIDIFKTRSTLKIAKKRYELENKYVEDSFNSIKKELNDL